MNKDEQEIRSLINIWMRATETGDTATVLSLMTEDAIFMVPGREPFGREVFVAAANNPAAPRITGKNEIVEIQVCGDWAFTRNRIDLTISTPNGESARRAGYTLTLYRKQADGRWRLTRDANLLTPKP
jgi:uncharacterized protein (TIGR02246 family)